MLQKIARRLREKLTVKRDADSPPPRRALTPPSSIAPLANESPAGSNPFQRLPAELWQEVLSFAFGCRIIHLELAKENGVPRCHGFVCRRSTATLDKFVPASDDDCGPRRLLPSYDTDSYPVEEGFIGVMGWLLSCREAYGSGIRALYSTNTFHIANKELYSRLHMYLPQRLKDIAKVELLWAVEAVHPDIRSTYHERLDMLPRVLPNLKYVHITFTSGLLRNDLPEPYDDPADAVESLLLPPIDDMVHQMLPHCQVSISLPPWLWMKIKDKAKDAGAEVYWKTVDHEDRFWRPLPPGEWKDGVSSRGYWLNDSTVDVMPRFITCL